MKRLAIFLLGSALGCAGLKKPAPPPTPGPQITTLVTYFGASAEEMDAFVVEPIESALRRMPDAVHTEGFSTNESGTVTVAFSAGVSEEDGRVRVEEVVSGLRGLPVDSERPRHTATPPRTTPRLWLMHEDRDLLGQASGQLADRIAQIPGVAEVNASHAMETELQLNIDREQAAHFGFSTGQIAALVRDTDAANVDELQSVMVETRIGPVPISALATLERRAVPTRLDRRDGAPAVWLEVSTTSPAPVREALRGLAVDVPGVILAVD